MSSADAPLPLPIPFTLATVIYATDFSPRSENAGHYASLLARQFNAELLVAHTFVLTQAAMEAEAKAGPAVKSSQRQESEAALAKAAHGYPDNLRTTSILLEGNPEEQLPRLARERAPSILVIGTEGRGRFDRSIMRAVSEKILRSTGGPALTVGPHVPASTDVPQIRRVLFATTLADGAARGAACALGMAEAFHAEIDVLHVVRPELAGNLRDLEKAQQQFQQEIDSLFPKAPTISSPRGVVEVGGDAPARILDHLREHSIDLLVLSLRRSSHLRLESLVSDAFHIIADAPCPVLTILG